MDFNWNMRSLNPGSWELNEERNMETDDSDSDNDSVPELEEIPIEQLQEAEERKKKLFIPKVRYNRFHPSEQQHYTIQCAYSGDYYTNHIVTLNCCNHKYGAKSFQNYVNDYRRRFYATIRTINQQPYYPCFVCHKDIDEVRIYRIENNIAG